jgi:hypothetical protein
MGTSGPGAGSRSVSEKGKDVITPITDLGQAILASISNAIYLMIAAVPHIVAFLVVMIVGWLLAAVIGGVVASLLRTIKFNDLAERSGISGFVQKMGLHTDAAGAVAAGVRWFIRLIALVVAFDALGLPAVSQMMQAFLLWLPNLLVAVAVLIIAGLLANALGDLVRGSTAQAGLGNPNFLATITRLAVWGFGIIVAVNQIGIASTLVNTLFMGFVGALALALGLAFGLGGRETAGQIVQNWYQKGREAAPKMGQAAQAAGRQAQRAADTAQYEIQNAANPPSPAPIRPLPPEQYQQH